MSDTCDSYKIKRLTFLGGRRVPIFLQNLNGPCPLLGIANVLSLRNQLQVSADATEITTSRLISLVAERYLDANKLHDVSHDNTEWAVNLRQNLNDGLNVLHKLATGIDVNVKFHSTIGFEPTPELVLFDLLDIRLVHGWLVDPQDRQTVKAFGDRSYNQLVEFLINHTPPDRGSSPAVSTVPPVVQQIAPQVHKDEVDIDEILDEILNAVVHDRCRDGDVNDSSDCHFAAPNMAAPVQSQAGPGPSDSPIAAPLSEEYVERDQAAVAVMLIKSFLEETCQQLTVFGLAKLFEDVKEHELAVFFRNNHFSTLFKHQGGLYILVTDQGYFNEPDIAWEKLDAIDGDTHFYNGSFEPFVPHRSITDFAIEDYVAHEDADTASDLELAMQLQEQERLRFEEEEARRRQQQIVVGHPQGQVPSTPHQQHASPRQQQQPQQQPQPQQQQQHHSPRQQSLPPPQQQQQWQQQQHLETAVLAGVPEELLEEDRLAREMLEKQRQQHRQRQAQQQQQQQQQASPARAGYSPRQQQLQQQQPPAAQQAAPPRTQWGRTPARPTSSEDTKCSIM